MTKFCKSCDNQCYQGKILDETLHCDYCHSDYCSKECFIKGNKNSRYYSTYKLPYEKVNLYFTCCGSRICGSCLSYEMDMNFSKNILCEKCNCYFHNDDSCIHPLSVDNNICTCKLCIDLTKDIKYDVCPKCHEDNKQEMFFYDEITTISEFSDILNNYEFNICSEWVDTISRINNNDKLKFIDCKKMEYLVELYKPVGPEDQDHFIKSIGCDCIICNKFIYRNDKIIYVLPDENALIKAITIECNCELCNKINCKTTLLANMIGCGYIIDSTNLWECGYDFAPILALKLLAKDESNNCKCSVCKFYSEYN